MNKPDLELLVKTVRRAGEIARSYFLKGGAKSWDKGGDHPVTEADIAVNDYLQSKLMGARPNYGWLSEETKDDDSHRHARRSFVIDPIDGTRAFMDAKPHFTIVASVIEKTKPVVGVVYNPITEEMYWACKGAGAFLNGAPISPSKCACIDGCSMIGYPRKFKRLGWPEMRVSIRNSMAYRIAMVAAGQRDAALAFTPKSDWDLAAATLIAEEAGAIITDITGMAFEFASGNLRKNGVICAGPNLHPLLLDCVKQTLKTEQGSEIKTSLETKMSDHAQEKSGPNQLLHIVFGGEMVDPNKTEFYDLSKMEFVGAYPNYKEAHKAWKDAAQRTVDNAHMRYFILHAHHLIDPDNDGFIG
ncbi:MAG TPA: DUF4170 domain-containing protein [Hellea balneolensis]|uniref:DUF4170 domain-containing protein n=1 Tax=Hellea balneolensis TaxID=287478 RepID=A0A7C5R186_9PROT|nr:DUF4170 domain-containing protein [Hellea balneolensis]